MKSSLLAFFRCPKSGQPLSLDAVHPDAEAPTGDIHTGGLVSEDGRYRYPIRDGIPRFVPEANYADNFGLQWKRFSKT